MISKRFLDNAEHQDYFETNNQAASQIYEDHSFAAGPLDIFSSKREKEKKEKMLKINALFSTLEFPELKSDPALEIINILLTTRGTQPYKKSDEKIANELFVSVVKKIITSGATISAAETRFIQMALNQRFELGNIEKKFLESLNEESVFQKETLDLKKKELDLLEREFKQKITMPIEMKKQRDNCETKLLNQPVKDPETIIQLERLYSQRDIRTFNVKIANSLKQEMRDYKSKTQSEVAEPKEPNKFLTLENILTSQLEEFKEPGRAFFIVPVQLTTIIPLNKKPDLWSWLSWNTFHNTTKLQPRLLVNPKLVIHLIALLRIEISIPALSQYMRNFGQEGFLYINGVINGFEIIDTLNNLKQRGVWLGPSFDIEFYPQQVFALRSLPPVPSQALHMMSQKASAEDVRTNQQNITNFSSVIINTGI